MISGLPLKEKIGGAKTIKVAPFRKHVRKTTPHKHGSYLELIYLSEGSGVHTIDSVEYTIETPLLHVVRQEQVHSWELESEPDGYVVLIKKAFFDNSIDYELKSLFARISRQSASRISDYPKVRAILQLLVEESADQNEICLPVQEGLLKALLAKTIQVWLSVITSPRLEIQGVHQSFLELVEYNNGLKKSVSYYAALLNTSPQSLNAICQRSLNKTATQIVSESVIAESKRLLLYTSSTVSEIAFLLEFADASHFTKYFKKIVGTTPQLFRSGSN